MIVYLGDYPKAAKNREHKYCRAVQSFIDNDYKNKELIIVSDGCKKSYDIYTESFKNYLNIKFILAPKQPPGYPGFLRQIGIYFSEGEIISYLDSDDYLAPTHLSKIMINFDNNIDFVYYDSLTVDSLQEYHNLKEVNNDKIVEELKPYRWTILPCEMKPRVIATGNISHKKDLSKVWKNWDGVSEKSEDWDFIEQWIGTNIKKIDIKTHYLCHYNTGDKKRLVDV